jgi:hypothetical protein
MIERKDTEVIGAYTQDGVFGLEDGSGMPWPRDGVPGDLPHFKEITSRTDGERVNLLVCGMKTYWTMERVSLGRNRVLLGVSRNVAPFIGDGRGVISSFKDALNWSANTVYKVFYIGGEAAWEYGMSVATTAHLTVIKRVCDTPGVLRLQKPLHQMAKECGMKLSSPLRVVSCPDKWAQGIEFQTWTR